MRRLPVLMQYQLARLTVGIGKERDLCIYYLVKEIPLPLRKNLKLRLSRRLRKQMISLARHRNQKTRRQLVDSHVPIKESGIDCHLRVLLRRRRVSDALGVLVAPILMQDQFRGPSAAVGHKSN